MNNQPPYNYDSKKAIFSTNFSTGTNNSSSFDLKLKLIHNLAFLTYIMRRNKKISEVGYPIEVLEMVLGRTIQKDPIKEGGKYTLQVDDEYLVGLSILVDDLLWGCETISKPEGVEKIEDVINNIKYCISEWAPF